MKKEKLENTSSKLTYDVHETPPIAQWILLSFQHVFAMFGATILVPILVNNMAQAEVLTIPVALVASGVGTIFYIFCSKGKAPIYLGSSFAFITPMAVGYASAGFGGIFTGIMVVGILNIVVAVIIRYAGTAWIDRILPPVVIGPMIMIIGLGLSSSAVSQMGLTGGELDWKVLVAIFATFASTVAATIFSKGFFKIIPFLTGIGCGWVVSFALGLIDFSSVMSASWFAMPRFMFPFVHYTPNFNAVLTIAPIVLVTLAEHIGDIKAISEIIGRDLTKDPGLDRTIFGDGIATFIAGFLGSADTTTYGENLAVVGMSKVASVKVIGLAAVFAVILGFLGKFNAIVALIPSFVLGSISILLYGFIGINGLKIMFKSKVNLDDNRNVIVIATMLVLGLGGALVSITINDFSLAMSGMSLAAVIGIILNLILPKEKPIEE